MKKYLKTRVEFMNHGKMVELDIEEAIVATCAIFRKHGLTALDACQACCTVAAYFHHIAEHQEEAGGHP